MPIYQIKSPEEKAAEEEAIARMRDKVSGLSGADLFGNWLGGRDLFDKGDAPAPTPASGPAPVESRPGFYGDLPVEALNESIRGGATLGDPSDPIVTFTPGGRPVTQSQMAGFAGAFGLSGGSFSGADLDRIFESGMIGTPGQSQPAANEPPPVDPLEERFGHDMAWLDPALQQQRPTREDALSLGTTGDEAARDAQRKASKELFGIYDQGGLTATDRAARAKNRKETEGLLRGQREADMQNLAERGMSGSGAEIATLLGDRQAAGERLSAADLQTSADAEQRALNALLGGAEIESGIQGRADNYVQGSQSLISNIEAANAAGRRQAYSQMMGNRQNWDMNKLNQQVGAAQQVADRDRQDNQFGWGQGFDLAADDARGFNQAQQNLNQSQLGTFQGYVGPNAQAGQSRVGLTGETQRAAGRSASAGGKLIMDYLGSLGGMGGGGK